MLPSNALVLLVHGGLWPGGVGWWAVVVVVVVLVVVVVGTLGAVTLARRSLVDILVPPVGLGGPASFAAPGAVRLGG